MSELVIACKISITISIVFNKEVTVSTLVPSYFQLRHVIFYNLQINTLVSLAIVADCVNIKFKKKGRIIRGEKRGLKNQRK